MLLFAKHRNGELGEIPLTFIHSQTKLQNYDEMAYNEIQSADIQKKIANNTSFESTPF